MTTSTALIDEAASAVITKLWPIMMVLILSRLGRYRQNLRRVLPAMAVAMLGFAAATAAQSGVNPTGQETLKTLAGVMLALGAVGAISLSVYTLRWSSGLAQTLQETPQQVPELEIMGAMLLSAVAMTFWIPALSLAAALTGERPPPESLAIALLAGATASAWPRSPGHRDNQPGNPCGQLQRHAAQPALADPHRNISVREPALLALGAVLIIAGNVGANIATRRPA